MIRRGGRRAGPAALVTEVKMANAAERGATEERVLLLVHGFPLAGAMWQPQLEGLGVPGWRLLAPDLPGFGDNPGDDPPATLDGYADALVALLDERSVSRAAVTGMSMGGYILLNLLARYRQRVSAAIFVATRAGADDPAGRARRTQLAAAARAGDREEIIAGFSEALFAPGTARERPELVEKVRRWMVRATPAGLAAALLAMRDRPDYTACLSSFDLPTLVIGGAEDRLLGIAPYQALLEGLPLAGGCLIAAAGHLANLEQPAAFNACLRKFLDQLPA
jgi:pimeloyl-ACP methyl ester carboxylesterase